MPTTLLFDLDDTLWDDAVSLQQCVLRICDELVDHLPPFDAITLTHHYIKRSDDYWLQHRWDAELLPQVRLQLWTETLTAFGCDDPRIALFTRDAYTTYRHEHAVCYDETSEVLGQLHGRYRLAVITNGHGDVQRARLRAAGLDAFFDAVVGANDADAAKPDAAIFRQTLQMLAATPRDAWHVGDSLTSDVQGAHNAGLEAAVWLNRHGHARGATDPEPHHEVEDLRALLDLLPR